MDEAQVRELIVAAIGDGHHEFGSFFLSRFFGMAVSYEADACIVSLDVKPYMFNPQGSRLLSTSRWDTFLKISSARARPSRSSLILSAAISVSRNRASGSTTARSRICGGR